MIQFPSIRSINDTTTNIKKVNMLFLFSTVVHFGLETKSERSNLESVVKKKVF